MAYTNKRVRVAKMQLRLAFERIFERFPDIAQTGVENHFAKRIGSCHSEPAGQSVWAKRQTSGQVQVAD